jgi:hypothetical protein
MVMELEKSSMATSLVSSEQKPIPLMMETEEVSRTLGFCPKLIWLVS